MPAGIQVKSILNKSRHRDTWFLDDYTINPYSGCSFNCLYCYIRGSKYGTHMEEKLSVKTNAIELLHRQLANRAKKGQYGIIVLSSATDPYLQFEEQEQLTRRMLEVILHHRFPVHIITKSDLVIRDLDLLGQIDRHAILPADLEGRLQRRALITFSFTTLDDAVSRIFEPGATPPSIRLQTLKYCLGAGFMSGVSMMPLLPYITDTGENLELMFGTFREAGVGYLMPATITLFGNGMADGKTLVLRAVEKHYPHLLGKYQKLFSHSSELPAYYREAFRVKTEELFRKYGLKSRII
jgi:DNA repair photolyase